MNWKIVSLEFGINSEQISEVFNYMWPKRTTKRKLSTRWKIKSKELEEYVHKELENLKGNILAVYGHGQYHHYTCGLFKETERRWGKCSYWHFDHHDDFGNGSSMLDCAGFVQHLVNNSLSGCLRWIGGNFSRNNNSPRKIHKSMSGGLLRGKVFRNNLKKMISGSDEQAYLSFDLDVMDYDEIDTDYGRGGIWTSELVEIINGIKKERKIVGVDILGYAPKEKINPEGLILYLIIAGKIMDRDTSKLKELHKSFKEMSCRPCKPHSYPSDVPSLLKYLKEIKKSW